MAITVFFPLEPLLFYALFNALEVIYYMRNIMMAVCNNTTQLILT
jgi:hypothetical protein